MDNMKYLYIPGNIIAHQFTSTIVYTYPKLVWKYINFKNVYF